jgi:hypothetical protein
LRDILNYNDEDVRNMSLIEHELALHYALETYIRRDALFLMSKFLGKSKGKSSGYTEFTLVVPQVEIEQYIAESYAEDKPS